MPTKPFKGKNEPDRYMEPREFQLLMEAAKDDADITRAVLLMGFGGLRTIEVTWLRVRDLDDRQKGVWVTTAKRKDRYRGFVALEDQYELFKEAAKGRDGNAVLIRFRGQPMTRRQIRYYFHKYKKKAGIRGCLGPHSLRHLAGIVRTEAGAQPQEIAQFLRHKNLGQVLVYSNLRTDRNAEMARQAGRILFGTNSPK